MVDPKTGEPVTDPQKSAEALLLPMARLQGRGPRADVGMLAGTLNGALFGRDCIDFNAEPGRRHQHRAVRGGARSGALPAARQFKAEVDRQVRELRASKTLPGQSVRLPGEQRAKRRADRLANGLALPPELLTQLDKMAGELAIKKLAERA